MIKTYMLLSSQKIQSIWNLFFTIQIQLCTPKHFDTKGIQVPLRIKSFLSL